MIGAIAGDVIGSIYEFANIKTKDFLLFSAASTFTDDTVCTVAVADALLSGADPARTLQAWCRRYPTPLGDYGPMFAKWVWSGDPKPYGSLGNGAAMRVSPAGFLARSVEEAMALAERVTVVTHDHPEGVRGGQATAVAIRLALEGLSAADIRRAIAERFGYDLSATVDEIRPGYRFEVGSPRSVPPALTCTLEAADFEDAMRNAVSIGGDSDTIAAIAGGVAEALFGVPDDIARETEARLDAPMLDVLARFRARRAQLTTDQRP